jgi:hypothetical protein
VAEIPAKEPNRDRDKKVGWKNLGSNFGRILQKLAKKGPKKMFSKEGPYFTIMKNS